MMEEVRERGFRKQSRLHFPRNCADSRICLLCSEIPIQAENPPRHLVRMLTRHDSLQNEGNLQKPKGC